MSIFAIIVVYILPLLVIFYWLYRRQFTYWEKRGIKGPTPYPIVGNTVELLYRGNRDSDTEYFQKYGKIWGYYSGTQPFLSICDAELIKQILIKDFHLFINRRGLTAQHPIWSKNLFIAKDNAWKRIRTILSPTFTSGKLRGMSGLMLRSVDKLNEYFMLLADSGKPFNVKKVISGFTIDVIASTSFAMDTDSNGDRQKENPILYHGSRLFKMSIGRILGVKYIPEPLRTWLNFNIEFTPEHFNFFVQLMKKIIKERKETGIRRDDLTQLLIDATDMDLDMKDNNWNKLTATADYLDENDSSSAVKNSTNKTIHSQRTEAQEHTAGKTMSDNEIIAQSILFFVAGFETTATTLTNALYELAMNPDLQERLYDELNEHLGDMDPKSGQYYEKVNNSIAYLNAFIKETLRKYPPVPKLFRRCSVDGYKLGGVELFKDQNVDIPIFAVHYNPEYYPEPERFNPDRFLDPNSVSKKAPYLSFGDGPRNCVGMRFAYIEIKLCLANLVRNFRMLPAESTPKKLQFQKIGVSATLPFELCVEKR